MWIFTLFVCFIYFKSFSLAEVSNKDIKLVNIIVGGLKDQFWTEEEGPCLDQTTLILNNVKNHTVWAVWIWNSIHYPVGTLYGSHYNLGNYDQCLHSPSMSADPMINTQYCVTDVVLTRNKYNSKHNVFGSTETYLTQKSEIGRNLNKITWGVCLPSVCKPSSISKILKTIYLSNPITPGEPEISVDYCEVAGIAAETSFGFYAFMFLITTLVAISLISTYYNNHLNSRPRLIQSLADSFDLKRNWKSLTKTSDEEIGVLNMIKAGLATIAVVTHTAYFETAGPISNASYFDEFMLDTKNLLRIAFKHIDILVDNFFMVSGLLLIKGLIEKRKHPLLSLVNRYFRLMASFSLVMFYVVAVMMNTGNGPIWQRFAGKEQKACAENWWLNLLMLNNYVNSENICLMVSWYIPCDYQLAVYGTVLYLIWQKNVVVGKVVTSITVLAALVTPGVTTYWRKLPGMILFHDIEQIMEFRNNVVYLDTYIRSHNRAGPFLIGMAMGYILSFYKPDKYRNSISKERSLLLFGIAYLMLYRLMTIPLAWSTLEYDHLSSALYAACSRSLWSFASCITIAVVEYGQFGYLRNIANWHGFTIISRLTYGIYITHSLIIQQYVYSRRNPLQFDEGIFESIYGIGIMVVSGVLATLLWLFVEAPVNNIVNLFMNSRSKVKSESNTSEEYKLHARSNEHKK